MKHTTKLIIAAIMAVVMTSCTSNTETAEETSSQLTESTSAVTEAETSAEESTTTTAEAEAESEESEETTSAEEDKSAHEEDSVTVMTVSNDEKKTVVNITADTKFYECRYSRDNVITSENDFEEKDILEKAKQIAFEEFDREVSDYVEPGETMPEAFGIGDSFDMSDMKMTEAMAADFDRDGSKEYAFIFERATLPLGNDVITDILIFADGRGHYTLLDGRYSTYAQLYELEYNGFSHAVIDGGVNIYSSCADFFSFSGGVPKHELRQFRTYDINDGFALCQSAAQAPYSWLIFWNDAAQCYVTPERAPLTEEEKEEFIKLGIDESAVEGCSIGNKFFNIYTYPSIHPDIYEKTDNGYIESEYEIGPASDETIAKATGFDYDVALKNIISIE